MPSSSAYAAPLDLDLRPGRLERAARVLMLGAGLFAVAVSALPYATQAVAVLLALAITVADLRQAAQRSWSLRLHADGSTEASRQGMWQPARLVQAAQYGGLWQIRWAVEGGDQACLLFPDRVDAATRQRLRVWLAMHRPRALAEGLAA